VLLNICVQQTVRKQALDLVRPYLADNHALVRIEAAKLLAELGGLNDIGLLLDLAALPVQSDEDPAERGVLIAAATQLSGMPR
jgi:hypothetical protein